MDQIDSAPEKETGGGRVKGWKERLAKLREQKEVEKKALEDATTEQSFISSSDGNLDKVKDIFAPAQGLQRNKDGKI